MSKFARLRSLRAAARPVAAAIGLVSASMASQAAQSNTIDKADQYFAKVAADLKAACPVADPGDQQAFDKCRQALFSESSIKQMMGKIVLWGRQRDAQMPLKEAPLTQFAPDIFAGMYLPLFMFDGKYSVSFHEKEKLILVRVGAAFRNRLPPGQFPYPFWHDDKKWDGYQNANTLLMWLDPVKLNLKVVQFAATGEPVDGYNASKFTPPPHDGKWLWTDKDGKTQPAVTLFDGLYRDNNPYKAKLDKSYRDFAIALRESQCLDCHVPNNPEKMKRLVLMQTPAHAALEIDRILKSVREKKMPLDDQGIEKALDPALEKVLLDKGGQFQAVVNEARRWEKQEARP